MMGLFFYIVAAGNTLGGLLVSRPARVLGTISYSLYLMQGIVLFAVQSIMSLKGATPEKIWLYFSVCGVVLVLVSLATYRWIGASIPRASDRTRAGPGASAGGAHPRRAHARTAVHCMRGRDRGAPPMRRGSPFSLVVTSRAYATCGVVPAVVLPAGGALAPGGGAGGEAGTAGGETVASTVPFTCFL